jgi:hypothetical protein
MSDKKLIQGGKVFLAEERRFGPRHILVSNGRVEGIADAIAPDAEMEVIAAFSDA